jgi:hypothetical protein
MSAHFTPKMMMRPARAVRIALPCIGIAAAAAGSPAASVAVDDLQPKAIDGYRGIWYYNGETGDAHRYKYSGGFATYPQWHVPMAILPDMTIADYVHGRQVAWLDLLGDWWEEIVTSAPGELRIYVTPIPAADRRVTFLQDPHYRNGVAHLSMGYFSAATPRREPAFQLVGRCDRVRTETMTEPKPQGRGQREGNRTHANQRILPKGPSVCRP